MNIVERVKKMIRQKLYGWQLQHKLIIIYVVVFMVPASAFTLYFSNQSYEQSIEEIMKKNEYLIEIERIHIQNNIEALRRTAQLVVSDQPFTDYIKSRNESNVNELIDFKFDALSNVLKLQSNNPAIEYIRVYTDNPYVTEMWPIIFSENRIIHTEWYHEVLIRHGQELWLLQEHDEDILERHILTNDNAKISLLRELEYPKNEHLGIVETSMLLKNFFPKMYKPIEGERSEMIVIDANMKVFHNPNNSFLEDENIEISLIKRKLASQQKDGIVSFEFTNNRTPYLVVATFLPDIGSYMINVLSLEELYSEVKIGRNIVLTTTLFLVIILSVITNLFLSFLFKRMYQLIDSMKRVQKGDFAVDVDISGHDEIAQLSFHYKEMLGKINGLIADQVNKQAATKEAELKALKTQIDSHFLYNTLENIKMMAEIDGNYEISDALTSLGEMMRYNIRWKTDFVVIQEEITHIKNYIDVMNLRLDNQLVLEVDVEEHLLEQEILKMSLQPIVENSVKHGLMPIIRGKKGIISIHAYVHGDKTVIVEIRDNGIGMSKEKLVQLNKSVYGADLDEPIRTEGHGIGLLNVNERILLHYGEDYGLTIYSEEGEYTKVVIQLPSLIMKGGRKHV
ncbi:HAMP domain-containing protein [Bacillus sp. HMF5848]|uniref:sensor histidine kinase n=1 Tax=Bacillus sp. HMF5848 TaxID=2495421 RepID=UPI000F784EC1|nr:histidine kinase [Bacillus sp. HMF5848]RSK25613.1 HAMP domain-containing protein [Bacillus sp. HMF5848]